MSKHGSCEKSSLLEAEPQLMSTIRYSTVNSNVTVQQHEQGARDAKKGGGGFDQESRRSALSVDGLENASLLGSMVPPQDLQELMGNLEKATLLVKRYLENNQALDYGPRKYV